MASLRLGLVEGLAWVLGIWMLSKQTKCPGLKLGEDRVPRREVVLDPK